MTTEIPSGGDLHEFGLLWTEDAGLPRKPIEPFLALLERSDKIAREAHEFEQAANQGVKRVAQRVAAGEIGSFESALAEVVRLGWWKAPSSASQRGQLGPAVRDQIRGACHQAARAFLQQHVEALAAQARRSRDNAGAERVIRWFERYNFIASATDETTPPDVPVAGSVIIRRGGEVRWVG